MTEKLLIQALEWRYAAQKFSLDKKISEDKLQLILKAANLTATSLGIQPFKIIVLQQDLDYLKSATFDQENIQTCSHLLILCSREDVDDEYVAKYVEYMEQVRDLEKGSLVKYKNMCQNFVSKLDEHRKKNWINHQVYILLGNLMTACALLQVDSCPMEGFNAKLVDEILQLPEKNLRSVLLLPIGYRAIDDKYSSMKKVRLPLEEIVERFE